MTTNAEYCREYYQTHRQQLLDKARSRYEAGGDAAREYNREQYRKNQESRKLYAREYRRKHRQAIAAKDTERARKKRLDPMYRLVVNRRTRRSRFMRSERGHWQELGCSAVEWRRWLESKFRDDMTWDNYGSHWHLDEVIPVSAWDLAQPEQWRACWHWTNSQPLLVAENLSKGGAGVGNYAEAILERLMVLKALEIFRAD